MHESDNDPNVEGGPPLGVNPGYAVFQIAKALTTAEEHSDPTARERAAQKVSKWKSVLRNVLTGSVSYGSSTPVTRTPAWVTLEVVTGGFATGEFLAAGPLQEHELALLREVPGTIVGEERSALNASFLSDSGIDRLRAMLRTGCYDVQVPEEGALLVIAWLLENGHNRTARSLFETISPFFSTLRFYPIPLEHTQQFGLCVHLQSVKETLGTIQAIQPNRRIEAQIEAVTVWAPLYDRIVALFLETVEEGWPCRHYPSGWREQALALLNEYGELRQRHTLCLKPSRKKGHYAQLREFLRRCTEAPQTLTGRDVGRIRAILGHYLEKRGAPTSATCADARRRQVDDVRAPTFHSIAGVVASRLVTHLDRESLDDVAHLQEEVSHDEAARSNVPAGTAIPLSVQEKVERCLNETIEVLVQRGLITSGEMIARVLPQITSGIRAAGIADPSLRSLYAAIYRTFRQRRSLLLLNLEQQVQIEALPWVAAIDKFRNTSLSERDLARQTLEEISVLTLTSFPHVILPNKLLQELRALVKGADLDIPLVDELAADIFMGDFSNKFLTSAKRAADLLEGTLYQTYYGIDYAAVRQLREADQPAPRLWFQSTLDVVRSNTFAQLCADRAGATLGVWDPAANGTIIEQQQVLTTQNLATLFVGLDLTTALQGQLCDMAQRCFVWACKRQQVQVYHWHDALIMLKNTAYAWRQMIFFLALLPRNQVADILSWMETHLGKQTEAFRSRFRPALEGLKLAAAGRSIDNDSADARRFLGWSKTRHWLMPELGNS